MKIIALSDCHYKFHCLNESDKHNANLLVAFLKECVGKYDLMVLSGDIFDFWLESKFTIVKQYFPVLCALSAVQESGTHLIYISGNHDFWFGDFLNEYLDCEIHPDGYTFQTDGKIIRFEHGDTHTFNDLRYQLYRKVIRWQVVRKIATLLHPDLALTIGMLFSRSSREHKDNPENIIRKSRGLKNYAQKLIEQKRADIVVLGHSHKPTLESIGKGFYVNCGDWISHYSYVEIDAGIPSLHKYNINKNPLFQ
ncbi:MAG: UDP-2,3-diacylglucosamine diphosphatase [Candidatus Cloacimonas sp.]